MNAHKICHRVTNSSLVSLEGHLDEWIKVLEDYVQKVEGDSPFQYWERTQIGFFAAASWRIGVPALEEWRFKKNANSRQSDGRCDLWIQTGDFHIESKHAWVDVDANKPTKRICKVINRAHNSARALTCEDSSKLSFSFVAPCILDENVHDIDAKTRAWLEIAEKIPCDALAWFMPERKFKERRGFPRIAIGIALFIKRVSSENCNVI